MNCPKCDKPILYGEPTVSIDANIGACAAGGGNWKPYHSRCVPLTALHGTTFGTERRLEGQTIEQWAERAKISERNLSEWIMAHSEPMPYGIGDKPGHVHTEKCGFDRNSSISEDRYVCDCGWRDE